MNIKDPSCWPATEGTIESDPAIWLQLLRLRAKTFQGFAELEKQNGFVMPYVSLHSAKGQEVLRILGFRVLEEAAESVMAKDKDHIKEEAIDSINYLLSMPLLDPDVFPLEALAADLHCACKSEPWGGFVLSERNLGYLTRLIAGDLADTFRNRAWMEHAQSLYFDGKSVMQEALVKSLEVLLSTFTSFDEFWRFFIAKDRVLHFRLNTRY